MDEPSKSAFFPVPVRWFEIPLDGMKRGFTHLKKRVDQLVQFDQIKGPDPTEDSAPNPAGASTPEVRNTGSANSVGSHLNTYA